MISRFQRVLYWSLVGGILLMLCVLVYGCERNRQRVLEMRDLSPIPAPANVAEETVSVYLANDDEGSVTPDQITLPLPSDPSQRALTLLTRILADDARTGATHPLPSGPAVTDVFFVALPISPGAGADEAASKKNAVPQPSPYGSNHVSGAVLAVVNLTKAFADAHPSGVSEEDLTLRQMLATLHANFPEIDEVRFLVDGGTRETLNGHADLSRPYSLTEPTRSIHTLAADGSPE